MSAGIADAAMDEDDEGVCGVCVCVRVSVCMHSTDNMQ